MKKDATMAAKLKMSSSVRAGDGSTQEFESLFEKLDRDQSGDLDWYEFSSVIQA